MNESTTPLSKKEATLAFLKLVTSGNILDAFETYVHDDFRHHNAYFPGDASSLMAGMEENAATFPNKEFKIQHALEDGDFVAIHSHLKLKPGDLGVVVVHLVRFEGDRIIEMWDVGQPIPADSPNENGLF